MIMRMQMERLGEVMCGRENDISKRDTKVVQEEKVMIGLDM